MSDIDPPEVQQPPTHHPEERRVRRASRYQRVQARKAAQRASDQRFYNAMFALMGVFALLAVLLGAIMLNGVPQGVEGHGRLDDALALRIYQNGSRRIWLCRFHRAGRGFTPQR